MKDSLQNNAEKGQTFIEFLFLLLMVMGLSFILIRGVGKGLGNRWVTLIKIITAPTNSPIDINK